MRVPFWLACGIATKPFDPLLYDAYTAIEGRTIYGSAFATSGKPFLVKAGVAAFCGCDSISNNGNPFNVTDQNFGLQVAFTPNLVDGVARYIFELYQSANVRLALYITTANKLALYLNKTTLLTYDTVLQAHKSYTATVEQTNGTWTMDVNDVTVGTKAANMTKGNYNWTIGARKNGTNCFVGFMEGVRFGKEYVVPWSWNTFGL